MCSVRALATPVVYEACLLSLDRHRKSCTVALRLVLLHSLCPILLLLALADILALFQTAASQYLLRLPSRHHLVHSRVLSLLVRPQGSLLYRRPSAADEALARPGA